MGINGSGNELHLNSIHLARLFMLKKDKSCKWSWSKDTQEETVLSKKRLHETKEFV